MEPTPPPEQPSMPSMPSMPPPPPGASPPPPPPPGSMLAVPTPTPGDYPATLRFDPPEHIANWRPLVQWLLAIPQFIVLYVLNIVSSVLAVVSWFVILFTGSMPAGLANFQALYVRYMIRTYTYAGFLRDGIRRSPSRPRLPILATFPASLSTSFRSSPTATGSPSRSVSSS